MQTIQVKNHFADLSDIPDGYYDLKKAKKVRSPNENRFYRSRGFLGALSTHTGYTEDELHSLFASTFLKEEQVVIKGKKGKGHKQIKKIVIKSTADLSTIEFEDYLQKIRDFTLSYFDFRLGFPDKDHNTDYNKIYGFN